MISVTLDIDWAIDEVITYCLDLLDAANVKATFFATHTSPIIDSIESLGHEVGIHPNFLPNFNGKGIPYQRVIDEMIELFPNARGVRFHSLATSAPVLDYCFKKGILYDSSVYLPFQTPPYIDDIGTKRISFIKSDLQSVIDQKGFEYSARHYNPTLPYIYVFHPIHIFLNTYSTDHYNEAKKYYKDIQNLSKFRNKKHPGAEDLLMNLFNAHNTHEFITTRAIHDRFK